MILQFYHETEAIYGLIATLGNPVRTEIWNLQPCRIFSFNGLQKKINEATQPEKTIICNY